MDFKEVRAKYPQYNDLSDEDLAKGLHQKFYSDIPFDQFASKVGYRASKKEDASTSLWEAAKDLGAGAANTVAGLAGGAFGVGAAVRNPSMQTFQDASEAFTNQFRPFKDEGSMRAEELIGHGIDKGMQILRDVASSGQNVKRDGPFGLVSDEEYNRSKEQLANEMGFASDIGSNFLPFPVGKGVRALANHIDPRVRAREVAMRAQMEQAARDYEAGFDQKRSQGPGPIEWEAQPKPEPTTSLGATDWTPPDGTGLDYTLSPAGARRMAEERAAAAALEAEKAAATEKRIPGNNEPIEYTPEQPAVRPMGIPVDLASQMAGEPSPAPFLRELGMDATSRGAAEVPMDRGIDYSPEMFDYQERVNEQRAKERSDRLQSEYEQAVAQRMEQERVRVQQATEDRFGPILDHIEEQLRRGDTRRVGPETLVGMSGGHSELIYNPRLHVAQENGGSVRSMLEAIKETSGSRYFRQVADLLLSDKEFNPRFELKNNLRVEHDWDGAYQMTKHKILIDSSLIGNEALFLHEAIHARTASYIRAWLYGDTQKAFNSQAVTRLSKLYNDFRDLNPHLREDNGNLYGLTTIDEFIAEAFTNPHFQKLLSETKYNRSPSSYWDKFVDILTNILGLNRRNATFLSETIKAGAEIMLEANRFDRLQFMSENGKHVPDFIGGYSFKDFKQDMDAKGIKVPESALRAIYEAQNKPEPVKTASISEGVRQSAKIVGNKLIEQYREMRSWGELAPEIGAAKDIKWITKNMTGKILSTRFLTADHPIIRKVVSDINEFKTWAELEANKRLHGASRQNPDPGTYNYVWKQLKRDERISVNEVGQALNNEGSWLGKDGIQSKAREVIGRSLSDKELSAYMDRVRINRDVLREMNEFLTSVGKEPIHELPHYWSPAEFEGPFLVFVKDKEGNTTVQSSYLKPNLDKIKAMFPDHDVTMKERGLGNEFDIDNFLAIYRQLHDPQRSQAMQAVKEGFLRLGYGRHGLKRKGAKGAAGTEGGIHGVRQYEEVSESYIRGAYEYMSNRKLDKAFDELHNLKEAEGSQNARQLGLDAYDMARGGSNSALTALSNGLSKIFAEGIEHGTFGLVKLPERALRDFLRKSNKYAVASLLGFGLPHQLGQNILQHTYTWPKLFKELPAGRPDLVAKVIGKAYAKMLDHADLDLKAMDEIGALEASFKYDWSTYAADNFKAYQNKVADHLSGISAMAFVEKHAVRRPAAATFFEMVKELDKINGTNLPKEEMYRITRDMVDQYMVTNKWYNRPQAFGRTGLVGMAVSPIQNFSSAWIGMLREYSKHFTSTGNPAPLAAFVGLHLITAGLAGLIGLKEYDAIIWSINKMFGTTFPSGSELMFSKVNSPSMRHGVLSEWLGINIGSTFSAPTITGSFAPGVQMMGNAANFAQNRLRATGMFGESNKPMESETRESIKGVSPRILWGHIEDAYTPKGAPYQTELGQASTITRDSNDWLARKFGTYTTKEAEEKQRRSIEDTKLRERQNVLSKKMNRIGDILTQSPENEDPTNKIQPMITELAQMGFSARDIRLAMSRELKSKLIEKDVRELGRGVTPKQRFLYNIHRQLEQGG